MSGFRRERRNCERAYLRLMNVAGLFADVIHQQVLAEGVRSGEICFAAAELGDFLDEVDQAVVAGEHESVDQNSGAFAFRYFFKRLRDHERVEAEGVLVNAAVFQSKGRRLAVRDHYNLAHIFFLA